MHAERYQAHALSASPARTPNAFDQWPVGPPVAVVELVARLATPDDEADWVDRVIERVTTAPGMIVRQLRAELKERKLEVCDDTLAPARTPCGL